MSKFIFVRHGQSQANADLKIATDDSPLTPLGIVQAKQTAQHIKQFNIQAIVCSPYLRARQTAETIASELGLAPTDVENIEELAERGLGGLKGKPKQHESAYYYSVDGEHSVEPRQAVLERMHKALKKIENIALTKGTLLVVGHALSGYFLIEAAKGRDNLRELDPAEEIANAGFMEVDFNAEGKTEKVEIE